MSGDGTMLVAACSEDGPVRLERRPIPEPSEGGILLRLEACGLCGTDLFKINNRTERTGTVLGHEIVGRVASSRNPRFEHGDRVVVPHHVACGECTLCLRGATTQCATFKENLFTPGGFSEYVAVGERAVQFAAHRVPDEVSTAAASFLEPAACVLRGIDTTDLAANAKTGARSGLAVVLGAGSMGLLHLFVLRAALPAVDVVVVDPIGERRDFAVGHGATAAVTPAPEALADCIHDLTKGLGADAVFDTVGGASLTRIGLASIRPGGTVVLFAHAASGEASDFDLNAFFKAEARLIATYSGALDEQSRIRDMIFDGVLDASPIVSHRMPLADIGEAIELANRRLAYKILLEVG